mmetsp:Transcript_103949/g.324034  ORF Transcript_103949/g.324034 Transcript_103949/m.324034 type:complete len:446 (-) Transcript_103949:560-1897(-)
MDRTGRMQAWTREGASRRREPQRVRGLEVPLPPPHRQPQLVVVLWRGEAPVRPGGQPQPIAEHEAAHHGPRRHGPHGAAPVQRRRPADVGAGADDRELPLREEGRLARRQHRLFTLGLVDGPGLAGPGQHAGHRPGVGALVDPGDPGHQLLLLEGELDGRKALWDVHGAVRVRHVRSRDARRRRRAAALADLLRAPAGRRHADVRHRPYEVGAVEERKVVHQWRRVAVHRAAVPDDQVAGAGAHQPGAGVPLGEDRVGHVQVQVVLAKRLVVPAEHVSEQAVRPRHHHQASRLPGCVLHVEEALDAVQPAPPVRLVDVEPVLLRRPPVLELTVGPKDAGAVEGGDEILRAPDLGENAPEGGQAAEVPQHLRLPDATGVDDAVVPLARPPPVVARGVEPRRDLLPAEHPRDVGGLHEVPEQVVGPVNLALARDVRDHDEALIRQVP